MRRLSRSPYSALGALSLFSALLLAGCTTSEVADPAPANGAMLSGDAAAGRDLAEGLCAGCHAVGDAGESPVADAPAFRALARKWPIEYLAESLAEGIVTSHRDDVLMPEFVLSPEQIDDLLAYLDQVQE